MEKKFDSKIWLVSNEILEAIITLDNIEIMIRKNKSCVFKCDLNMF